MVRYILAPTCIVYEVQRCRKLLNLKSYGDNFNSNKATKKSNKLKNKTKELKYHIPGFRLVRFIDIVSIMFILIRDSSIGANGRRFIIGRGDRGCPRAVSIVLILNFDAFNFVNNFTIVGLTLTGTPRRTRS